MKMRNIKTIISREYLIRVKKKSFLITTFLVPVLFAALCILPSVIMLMAKEKGKEIAVVDQSGIVVPYLTDSKSVSYVDHSDKTVEDKKEFVNEYGKNLVAVFYNSKKSSVSLKKCPIVKFIIKENGLLKPESTYGQFWVNSISNISAITHAVSARKTAAGICAKIKKTKKPFLVFCPNKKDINFVP